VPFKYQLRLPVLLPLPNIRLEHDTLAVFKGTRIKAEIKFLWYFVGPNLCPSSSTGKDNNSKA
jgi:hypothetical protein